jgi:hypothetical protein
MSADLNEPVLITIRAACKKLGGLCVRTVERLALSDPEFPPLIKVGSKNFLSVAALNGYIEKKATQRKRPV